MDKTQDELNEGGVIVEETKKNTTQLDGKNTNQGVDDPDMVAGFMDSDSGANYQP